MVISMLKIRRPLGRLIFNMGITIPGKTVFLIETAPRVFWHLPKSSSTGNAHQSNHYNASENYTYKSKATSPRDKELIGTCSKITLHCIPHRSTSLLHSFVHYIGVCIRNFKNECGANNSWRIGSCLENSYLETVVSTFQNLKNGV